MRVRILRSDLDGLTDGHTERAGGVGMRLQQCASGFRQVRRRRVTDSAVRLHLDASVRLRIEGRANLPYLDVESEQRARERQRRTPLSRTGFGGELGGSLDCVVVSLRDSSIRLV